MRQECLLISYQTLDIPDKSFSCDALIACNVCRCTGEVSLDTIFKGSGYVAHPAITDNCMQLGPITALDDSPGVDEVTRVVTGLSAFHARWSALPTYLQNTTLNTRAVSAWEKRI